MKILLDGYIDGNFGDDLMLSLAADGLRGHELFISSPKIKLNNVKYTDKRAGFDCYLKVTGSGFLIHNNLGILYRLRDMRRERNTAPVRAVINCNISPFINGAAERVIRHQLSGYDFITVRDTFSYDYIRKNIPNAKCEEYPDMVFSLPDEMIPNVKSGGELGIAVHNSASARETARAADRYIEETGKKVILLCFDSGSEHDSLAAEKIMSVSAHGDMIERVDYTDTRSMLAAMKKCGVILAVRLHSIILSARMGIPFVPMAYSDKTEEVLSDMGFKGKVYNPRGFDAESVARDILNAKPYRLDGKITELSRRHIIRLNECLKNNSF
ncbi:MAG: polysaccharide pyruvyl transferase family protein [Firmicutes bacterium]|nr:polysaccharide pyruvyl transferase family protein [Bacillota bacterium]